MQTYLPKHLAKKSIALPEFSPKKRKKDWRGKPESWPDIRENAQDGHIYLLVDTRYPIGFIVTATDGYSVKIDGTPYADYASNAQFSMADWEDYTDTPGYDISEPTGATKAHIIDIYPQTENKNITIFKVVNIDGDTNKGLLWSHHNQTNSINLTNAYNACNILIAITAKNNTINTNNLYTAFQNCPLLEFLPVLNATQSDVNADNFISSCAIITSITLKNSDKFNIGRSGYCDNLEQIKADKYLFINVANGLFRNCPKLIKAPILQFNINLTSAENVLRNDKSLQPFDIDIQDCASMAKFTCFGENASTILNLKTLRVSNEAPFDNAPLPQINVSYTGLNRAALVQLFNDLPTVSDGQIISIVGATGANDLTADDELIATAKGWTITK